MLVVQFEEAVFCEQWLGVYLKAHISTPLQHRMDEVKVLVATPHKFIPHPVVYVQEIVGVFTSVFNHFLRQGSAKG